MTDDNVLNLDDDTIRTLNLQLTNEPLNAQADLGARIFKYPALNKVYVMESDLYGNKMPRDSCFLAFQGSHGLIGKHIYIETLKNSSIEDIKRMIETYDQG